MYVVAGVTGNTGGAVARVLLARRAPVRVIVRDESKGEPWAQRGAEVAVADLRDPVTLARAFRGARGVYVLNPPAYTADDLFARATETAEAVAQAIEASGVERLVALSSIGAQLSRGHGNIRTNTLFDARLARLPITVSFVRPAYFMQNWGAVARAAITDGVLPSFLAPLDRAIPMVSTEDVGRVAAEALLAAIPPRVIELAGPTTYAPVDAAAAFARALARDVVPIVVAEAQWPEVLTRTGFSERTIGSWVELFRGFNDGTITFAGPASPQLGMVTIDQAVTQLLARSGAPSLGVQA